MFPTIQTTCESELGSVRGKSAKFELFLRVLLCLGRKIMHPWRGSLRQGVRSQGCLSKTLQANIGHYRTPFCAWFDALENLFNPLLEPSSFDEKLLAYQNM
jgi:hypothetical protein